MEAVAQRIETGGHSKSLLNAHSKWDVHAKKEIGESVRATVRDYFPLEPNQDVYVEGSLGNVGLTARGRKPYPLFGSAGEYPDIAVLVPTRIAIELDHSGMKRSAGASFKMALAKTALNFLSGDWEYCILLFFNQSGKHMPVDGQAERVILATYERSFKTFCKVFE